MEENNQNEVLKEEVTMQGNETVNTEKQNDNISNIVPNLFPHV